MANKNCRVYNETMFKKRNKKERANTMGQAEKTEIRSKAVLLCPDNDSESHMILRLAEKAGMAVIRSKQPHGADLNLETDLEAQLSEFKKPEIWIVETPGMEKEQELKKEGFNVRIIDHHTYNDLDRLIDPETGAQKLSSLEQFLAMAEIDDDEMRSWGLDPKMIRGIGIMDAKYVRGLREAGYSQEEINSVIKLEQELAEEIRPESGKLMELAEEDWKNRAERGGYLIIKSRHGGDMRGAISEVSIIHNMDAIPMIISVRNGEKITVQNISLEIADKLKKNIKGKTYTFGSGRCWGVNNKDQDKKVALEEIIGVLGI